MAGRLSRGVSTAAIMAALSAQPAIAQQEAQDRVPEPQSEPEANSANGAAVPVASPEEESGLGEIVVTAQRVAESSQRAPIALDVISPEELVRQNVIRAEDLSRTSNALSATEEPRTYGVRIGGKF